MNAGEKLKVEHVVSVLEKQYPYVEVNSILGIDSAYDQNRKVRNSYYYYYLYFLTSVYKSIHMDSLDVYEKKITFICLW